MRPLGKVLLFAVATLPTMRSTAQITLGNATFEFASVEQGREILARRDEFVSRMSPFDRAARMKTDQNVTEKAYLDFVGANVLPWSPDEREKVVTALQRVLPVLAGLHLTLPDRILFIKTTGNEEGGAAYTRSAAIVLPTGNLNEAAAKIESLISHELFHVMSRANPKLREKLYAAIGFAKCNEATFPEELALRKLTNPDAPVNDHCIQLAVDGKKRWCIPILFAKADRYDVQRGGEFFHYLQLRLQVGEFDEASSTFTPVTVGGKSKLVDIRETRGFFEQVGKNTGYVIHPEEILADNFALLVTGQRNLPSPEISAQLESLLRKSASDSAASATSPSGSSN